MMFKRVEIDSLDIMSEDLGIEKDLIESYYRNLYINRTFPIRDLTHNEIKLCHIFLELRHATKAEVEEMCDRYGISYSDHLKEPYLLSKFGTRMNEREYEIASKYADILLVPYLTYNNTKAPRLRLLSKEEIAMLLSNIAVGITIIPDDQINTRLSMDAMDRLLLMYEAIPMEDMDKQDVDMTKLTPAQLKRMIEQVTNDVAIDNPPALPEDLKQKPIKKQRAKKPTLKE